MTATLAPKNKLLAALPAHALAQIAPALEVYPLRGRRVLHHAKAPIEHLYFVEEGLVSVIADTGGGSDAEVWLVGCEGLVGTPALLGATRSNHRRVVQASGSALRMSSADLHRAMDEVPLFRDLLLRYVNTVLLQTSQSGACNAAHSVKQRLARWLLLADDRHSGLELPVTHNMLARILGIRRASVTECLNVLATEGLLQNTRGIVSVADRPGLQAASCTCYGIIQREQDRLFRDFDQALWRRGSKPTCAAVNG